MCDTIMDNGLAIGSEYDLASASRGDGAEKRLDQAAPRRYPGVLYASAWKEYDRQARFGG
jgi:hypothetical protein